VKEHPPDGMKPGRRAHWSTFLVLRSCAVCVLAGADVAWRIRWCA
jgi:hypothetical protein